jgi:hypothetical protein
VICIQFYTRHKITNSYDESYAFFKDDDEICIWEGLVHIIDGHTYLNGRHVGIFHDLDVVLDILRGDGELGGKARSAGISSDAIAGST